MEARNARCDTAFMKSFQTFVRRRYAILYYTTLWESKLPLKVQRHRYASEKVVVHARAPSL